MSNQSHVKELITLKAIAETLNQSHDLGVMLDTVLQKLIEVTGLATGWIFLVDENMEYECVADCDLPPALSHDDKKPMRCGSCWCVERFRENRLNNAANIMSCMRIENAIAAGRHDTRGITHHATVPLRAGKRRLGLLNVAAPGKRHFDEEELALLEAVAFQIGGAVERMRLHAEEQRRAELFSRLGEFTRSLSVSVSAGIPRSQLAERAVELIGAHFDWPFAAMLEPGGHEELLRSRRIESVMAAPVAFRGSAVPRSLVIGHHKFNGLTRTDREVLEAIAEHVTVALESALLEENRRELARLEERNRLARDLHDSVAQMLFSLSMTAKGSESLLNQDNLDSARSALKDMQALSKNALKEMRSLIMQLRPAGLENGLVSAMENYGKKLGLNVTVQLSGMLELPHAVEETLWRIAQEALNNICKHAGTNEAKIALLQSPGEVRLRISDRGRGIGKKRDPSGSGTFGLSTMKERAELLGGTFRLSGAPNKGTSIEVSVPLRPPKTEVNGL